MTALSLIMESELWEGGVEKSLQELAGPEQAKMTVEKPMKSADLLEINIEKDKRLGTTVVQFEAERSGASMAGSKGMLFRGTIGKGLVMCLDLGMVHACGSECLGIVVLAT